MKYINKGEISFLSTSVNESFARGAVTAFLMPMDPLISDITDKYTLELAQPAISRYLFRALPSEGVTSGEIRVKDNFGNIFTKSITW